MGGKVACKPAGSDAAPNDPEKQFERLETARAVRSKAAPSMMSLRDSEVLDAALVAGDFADIGSSVLGFSGKNAERRGKQALIEATKNLSQTMEKLAA